MELKNDSIREVIQKEGIKSAKDKFGTEVVTNELKKDFELVREILSSQPSSAFNYYIYEIIPSEVSHFFEKDIIEFHANRLMQELPNANKEDIIKNIRNDFDKSIIRREYIEKGDAYQALYRRMEFVIEKYGQEKVDAFLKTEDPKLRQNLIEWGQIKEELVAEESQVEEPKTEESQIEEPKTEEPQVEEQKVEEPQVKEPQVEEPQVEEPQVEEQKVEEPQVEEPKKEKLPVKKAIDISKLSPKGQKLIKKVNELCEKCANENNLVKKHLLKFRLRMLKCRLQEELDLYNLNEKYRIKTEKLKAQKEQKQKDDIKSIINIKQKIKQRENLLNANTEYDYYSPDFMFPKSTIENFGGINQFAKILQEDENPIIKDAGKRVAGMIECRKQIQILKKQMEDRQKSLEAKEKEFADQKREMEFTANDKSMVLKENKFFKRIPVFFKIVKQSIQDFRTELMERRSLATEYKQKEDELRQQFDAQMKQLREEAEKANNPQTQKRDSEFLKKVQVKTTGEISNVNAKPKSPVKANPTPVEHSEH